MSFPTKASTSPLLQRDYGILGNRPNPSAATPHAHRRSLARRGGTQNSNGSRASHTVEEGNDALASSLLSSRSSGAGNMATLADDPRDSVSNLSLSRQDSTDTDNGSVAEGQRVQQSPSQHDASLQQQQTSPILGPRSFGDYSRGNRMANLHQQLNSAPINSNRRPSGASAQPTNILDQSSFSQPGLLSSAYLLGGHHVMPPATADMRSQDELDDDNISQSSSIAAFAPPNDDDITPRPGAGTTDPILGHQQRSRAGTSTSRSSLAETSPLLSHQIGGADASNAYINTSRSNGNMPYTDGIGAYAVEDHFAVQPHRRRSSLQLSSAFDARQPPPPDQDQIDAMGREPDVHLHRREFAVLTRFAFPIWLTHLLELSLNVVSVFSIGHLGTDELAAASLSSMTANVTGFSVLAGFISALDSILPSAYTSKPKMVGLYTQRMLVIVAAILVPICIIWLNTERILLVLGQDPVVAELSARYLRILVIGLPGHAGFECCRRYLQAQNLMHAPTMVLLVASPINALLTWLFVWGPPQVRFGFIGAPIASTLSMWLMCLLGVAQCYIAPRVAWDGWSRRAFTGLKPLIQLGTAGMFAMCAEWWSWEIVGLVTSRLGTVALAAQSVLLVCSSINYQLPYAISVAAAVRVGNLLGAMQAQQAKVSANMSMFLALGAGVFNSTVFFLLRNKLGTFFSNDETVIELIALVIPVMATFQIMDSICGVSSGILRGTGRQNAGAVINLTGYYVIGIPFGLYITFGPPQLGLSGLWIGLTVALTYASIMSALIIKRTNWNVEVTKTLDRMATDQSAIKIPIEEEDDIHRVA